MATAHIGPIMTNRCPTELLNMEYDAAQHSLQCPKCQHGMEEITHDGITIDRCTQCMGFGLMGMKSTS